MRKLLPKNTEHVKGTNLSAHSPEREAPAQNHSEGERKFGV